MVWQPVQRETTPGRVMHWVEANRNFLLLGLGMGVAFFGGLAGVTYWMKTREDRAQEALFKAGKDRLALEALVQGDSQNRAALFAFSELALADLDEKKFDGCAGWFGKMYEEAGRDVLFRVLALHGMALCRRAGGDFQKASELYGRAAGEPGNKTPWVSLYEQARCLELAKAPEAREKFQSLLKEESLPGEFRPKVEERLIWLSLSEKS